MRYVSERIAKVLGGLSRGYFCDEDPDERRERLRGEALAEIDAQILPIVQLRLAMQEWAEENERANPGRSKEPA